MDVAYQPPAASFANLVPVPTGESPRTPIRRRWVLGALLAGVVAVALVCVLSVRHLQANADNAQHEQVSELSLARSVEQLNGLEWEAVAKSHLSNGSSKTAAAVIAALPTLARRATVAHGGTQGTPGDPTLATEVDQYAAAVQREFALLGAGDVAGAHLVDRALVDPTATSLKSRLTVSTAGAERLAAAQSRNARQLSLLIVILGGALSMFLLWRVERGVVAQQRATMLAENADNLRDQASRDILTGLPNRRQLVADLAHVIDQQQPSVLVFFDLNGFKTYNDTFGHSQGDLLLARLGQKMAAVVTKGAAYRLGGDEFCALLHDDQHLPASLAGLRAASREESDSFEVSSSYGLVRIPTEANSVTEALRTADARMYENKRVGRTSAAQQTAELAHSVIAEYDCRLYEHANEAAETADAVGRRLNLDDAQLADLRRVAQLHDIGKVGLPRSILQKPGPLDRDEWDFIRQHTIIGQRILASAPALKHIARMVRATHERYDGTGYPDRLAGEAIPLISRIVTVCDSFGAMTGQRAYRAPRGVQSARDELRRGAGTQFDPAVVDAFLEAGASEKLADDPNTAASPATISLA
jgi:diguanylate cyclase (GGDEF)-like protein